jgi:hypothetical protein
MFKKMKLAAVATAAIFAAANAQAATIVETKVTGTVEFSNLGNVPESSVFTVLAQYDAELVAGAGEDILSLGDGIRFSLSAGSVFFDQHDELAAPDFPQLRFFNGTLSGFDFSAEQGHVSATLSGGTFVYSNNLSGASAFGELDFTSAVTSPVTVAAVPEPGQWALMIVGFGLVGAASRRKRQEAIRLCPVQ